MGCLGALASCFLLWTSLNSNNDGSVFSVLGIGGMSYGEITTMMFLQISVSSFLTVFSVRTGENWFFLSSLPTLSLALTGFVALTSCTLIALYWPSGYPDDVYTI
eukprot:gene12516-15937_t